MKVVLVSDTHLTPQIAAFGDNWRAVRRWIEAAAPSLVVHLGDITAHGTEDARELVAAHSAFTGLSAPMRFVPGNHDIGDNPAGPRAPNGHPIDLARLADYRRVFGADRWTCDVAPWQLVGLNAQLFGTGTPEENDQFDWLEMEVGRRQGPLGLMLHKPLWRNGPRDTEAHIRYVPEAPRCRLLASLARRDLRFVVSGHVHQARSLRLDGVEHAWVPSTAYRIPDTRQERIGEKVVGLLTLEITESDHRFD